MKSRVVKLLSHDTLVLVCYLLSAICLVLVAVMLLDRDLNPPFQLLIIDCLVAGVSLGFAMIIQRTPSRLPRRLFAGVITLACLAALPTERSDASSTLIISTVPVLVLILAEQSLWPIALDPLFLGIASFLSPTTQFSAAFIGFHALIFLTKSAIRTVPVAAISELIRGDVFYWGQLMAAALLGSVPVALIYSFFVEHYVAGLTAGAVKG